MGEINPQSQSSEKGAGKIARQDIFLNRIASGICSRNITDKVYHIYLGKNLFARFKDRHYYGECVLAPHMP